ncbi:DUF4139 domain-containing protein [Archangium sp.]|jgi:hypothetical protein|uniref:DUF4139 domain-containing protein n=1 Tax=Archangium sp. TaxID=1872627 RepID=UPI002EDB87CD
MVVVPSVLDAVTVHAEGALCTRLASVPSDKGRLPAQVRIEGLPLGLRTGSLRAAVLKGPHGLLVRDIRPVFDVRLPPETDLPAAQRALEEAQEKLHGISAELERVQRDLQSVQKLKPSFPPRKKDEPSEPRESALTAILSLAGFVDSELAALQARHLDLERQHRDATEEVELRRRRLEEGSSSVRGQRAQLHRAAVLTLSDVGPVDEGAQLALEYAVHGARWVPGYDLRMPRSLDGGTLHMRASIIQLTGEDWSNVRLSLSTADLARRADVPELKALRIGRRQPPPARSGWREPPPGLDELFSGYDSARPSPSKPTPRQERTRAREFAMPPPAEPVPQQAPYGNAGPPPPPAIAPVAAAPMRVSQSMRAVGSETSEIPAARPPPMPMRGGPPPAPAPGAMAPKLKSGNMMKRRSMPADEPPMEMEEEPSLDGMAELDDEGSFSGGLGGGGVVEGGPRQQDAGLEPAGGLLDYGSLEMASAWDPAQRGRLQSRPEALSRELVSLFALNVHVDVMAIVAQYERTVSSVQGVPPPTWSVPPRQSSPHFDHRFDVEVRAEVPSDGVWHLVPVFSAPVGLSAEYVCVPSLESRAFRNVKVENRTPHALLAGPVDVTLGDEFLMTSPLPTLAPGATQRLGLGVEESIKVSRNTRFDEASGGMFGGANVLTHHVCIELANRTPQRAVVEVLERMPAVPSAEKDIKVEEAEVKPAWSKRSLLPGETPVEGERAWKVTLQPGETQALNATWIVRIPSSKMLVGGNRRT